MRADYTAEARPAMGPWSYYAPLWLGGLLSAGLYLGNLGLLPAWPPWLHGAVLLLGAPLAGLVLQLGWTGLQGAWAQVLPVPGGRSIRGGRAVLTGVLLLAWFGLGLVAGLLAAEGVGTAAAIIAALALASLAAAALSYAWSIPAARRDFGPPR